MLLTGATNALDAARLASVKNTEQKLESSARDNAFKNTLKSVLDSKTDKKKTEDKKLMDTCQEMESLFVAKMFKEMRKTVHKTDWINGGFAEEIFEDMLYDKYALKVSKNANLGLAKQMYDQMSKL